MKSYQAGKLYQLKDMWILACPLSSQAVQHPRISSLDTANTIAHYFSLIFTARLEIVGPDEPFVILEVTESSGGCFFYILLPEYLGWICLPNNLEDYVVPSSLLTLNDHQGTQETQGDSG